MDFNIPLVYKIRKPGTETLHPKLFILVHGYGANEEDLFGFERDLPKDSYVVSFRAPKSLSYGSHYWYQISMQAGAKLYDKEEASVALELLKSAIDGVKKSLQIPAKNIFLIGFSQGSILSYALAMKYPEKVNNIIALSGYWDDSIVGEIDHNKDFSKLDFFISHGETDPVIPVALSEIAPARLTDLQIPCQYHTYPIGHNISKENYENMLLWIKERN